MKKNQLKNGFTLVEIMLVLVIVSSILIMLVSFTGQQANQQRRDLTALRMQQVMNAALAFYTQYGRWPQTGATQTTTAGPLVALSNTTSELMKDFYLPTTTTGQWVSAYGTPIYTGYNPSTGVFYVAVPLQGSSATTGSSTSSTNAMLIAGTLPSTVTVNSVSSATPPIVTGATPFVPAACTTAQPCFIVSSLNPPGQNLNNARSVNFAAVYNSSACVPAPTCPAGMTPQIMVVPVAVSGINDPPTCTSNLASSCSNVNVYPISSYSAYVISNTTIGTEAGPNQYVITSTNTAPYYIPTYTIPSCGIAGGTGTEACYSSIDSSGNKTPISGSGYYWRVCLTVTTERGLVQPTNVGSYPTPWGALEGTIMAITRCAPPTEVTGSDFTVFSPTGNN